MATKLTIAGDATATMQLMIGARTILDLDYELHPSQPPAGKGFEMVVKAVNVDESNEPSVIGDAVKCLYDLTVGQDHQTLKMDCSEAGIPDYPADLTGATVFVEGAVALPPPVDNPLIVSLSNLNKTIPDSPGPAVTQDIAVSNEVVIKDLTVTMNISHAYSGDLRAVLVHPSGTEVTLHNRTGGSSNDIIATYGSGGTVPTPSLSPFFGLAAAGTWKLRLSDHESSDTGKLNAVSLQIHH